MSTEATEFVPQDQVPMASYLASPGDFYTSTGRISGQDKVIHFGIYEDARTLI